MQSFSKAVEEIDQALSIKYNNIVYELKQQGKKIITLSLGEAFFDIPVFPIEVFPQEKIYHYTHSRGIIELRKAISEYLCRRFHMSVDPEKEIVMSIGAKAAIHFSLMTVLNPGDEVIVQEPLWVSYPAQIRLCGGKPVMIPYDKTLKDYEKYVTDKTKVIIINNPHNPTGRVFSKKELSWLLDLARKNGIYILADEAYSDFTIGDDEFVSLGTLDTSKENTIICNSISKNFGISGWRIGYVIGSEKFIDQVLKIHQHLVTCPPSVLQYYVSHYWNDIISVTYPQIKAVVEKRNEVCAFVKSIGLGQLPGDSTFYLFVSISPSKLGSDEFCTRLLYEKQICVVPGIGYGDSCDKFIRVAVGTEPMENIEYAMTTIKEFIDQTS
jgi:aminotransferase